MKQKSFLVEIYPDAIMEGLLLSMKMMLIIIGGPIVLLAVLFLSFFFPELNTFLFAMSFWQVMVLGCGMVLIQIVCLKHFVFCVNSCEREIQHPLGVG